MCNIQYGLPNAFWREVRTAPELSTFLANDRQLQNIEKFCQNNSLGIDPTYNIFNYYVTICTYKNPLLEVTRADRTPVMIGPAIAHAQKTVESYFTLPHNMLRHNWNIAQLKRCRTDAGVNVFQAFKACFPNADHLLCWINSKDNVKSKLADLKLRFSRSYINEILGEKSGNMKVKGLLDSKSQEEYESEWKHLEKIWLNREKGSDKFVSYLRKHKKQKRLESMVHFVRKANRLRETAVEYNHKANKCINSVLKRSKSKYKISLKEAIHLFHNEVKLQKENLKLAIVAKGPWRIRTAYKSKLQVSEELYDQLNSEQRKR